MNIQELILKCDRQRLFEEFIKLHSDFPQEKKPIAKTYQTKLMTLIIMCALL